MWFPDARILRLLSQSHPGAEDLLEGPWHVTTTIVATSIVATSAKCSLFPTAKWQRMLDGLDLGGSTCEQICFKKYDLSQSFPRFGSLAEMVRVSCDMLHPIQLE